MTDTIAAELLFLSPFLTLWVIFAVAETAKTIASIREARR